MAAMISSSNAKVEIHSNISSLQLDDVCAAWQLLKCGLESKIGKDKYMCVPYITDDGLFDVTTVFIKVEQTGRPGLRYRTYKALGKIENLLNRENSFEVWHDISDRVPEPTPFDIHSPFEVVVRDDVNHICISTIFRDFTKQSLPSEFIARRAVQLDESSIPELRNLDRIYMIDEVVISRNIEIRINVRDEARVFTCEMPHAVAFHYKKYRLNDDKLILRALEAEINSMRTTWRQTPLQTNQDSVFVASTSHPSSVFAINRSASEKASIDNNENTDEASLDSGSFHKHTNANDDITTSIEVN